ncbi:MAG: CsgG/HfaB family protein [Acidiferrobacterales bacterium]
MKYFAYLAVPVPMLLVLALSGCSTTSKVIARQSGETIAQAQTYNGPRARIAVGPIIDKTGDSGKRSLSYQVGNLRTRSEQYRDMNVANVVSGIHDMLTTALFNSNRYIVLDRETIHDALVDQDFSASGKAGEQTKIPAGQIEGADLLVIGALTAFNPSASGGAFPIPILLNRRGDLGVLDISFKRSYVSMDLRVIDVRTSRIVATVAVEGKATDFGAGLTGFAHVTHGDLRIGLPITLRGFSNTPVEEAINKMVNAAVADIVKKTPAVYYRTKSP